MSAKSESKKAALRAAKKAAVLPVLVGMIIVLGEAWTKEGKGGMPALNLAPKQKKRVMEKWAQIERWLGAVIREHPETQSGSHALYRDMDAKHSLIEQTINAHAETGRVSYNVALVVETIVISMLLCDWYEEKGREVSKEMYWLVCALNTFAGWTCKPNDPVILLANIVYFEVRDRIMEHPDWRQMWQHEGRSETTEWVEQNPDSEFGKAAIAISRKYEPERWKARVVRAA